MCGGADNLLGISPYFPATGTADKGGEGSFYGDTSALVFDRPVRIGFTQDFLTALTSQ